MHAITHSLAHRGPPASRTKARWQPYQLNTPSTSVSPSPPSIQLSLCESDRPRNQQLAQPPRDAQFRDVQKSKYVAGLVDQAVKSLCEIWHPHDIPSVFLTSSRAVVVTSVSPEPHLSSHIPSKHYLRNTQLPSPISPTTQASPISPSFISPSQIATHVTQRCDSARSNLVPIKGFVHEVLRRSRTSGCVLQTALCYLEAIRSKVPELVRKEEMGEGVRGEKESGGRIIVGEAEIDTGFEITTQAVESTADSAVTLDDLMNTVRMQDGAANATSNDSFSLAMTSVPQVQGLPKKIKAPSVPLPSLPPLPSPLLCPRRTFLASLILASKFTQDRCYSNRAWAKLSGLPAREIGRCERALGDALDWRLWVGKASTSSDLSPGNSSHGRAVARSKSEGDIFLHGVPKSKPSSVWQAPQQFPGALSTGGERLLAPSSGMHSGVSSSLGETSGLRRCVTVPAHILTGPPSASAMQSASERTLMRSASINEAVYGSSNPEFSAASWTGCTQVPSQSSFLQQAASLMHGPSHTQSPSPPTPSLTFSPTSTDSSCGEAEGDNYGDRTIQMTGFIDNDLSTPSCIPFADMGAASANSFNVNAQGPIWNNNWKVSRSNDLSGNSSAVYVHTLPVPHATLDPAAGSRLPHAVPLGAFEGQQLVGEVPYGYWNM